MNVLKDVHHVVVGGGQNLVCHWPRQGGIWNWGEEILVGYIESPAEYKDQREVGHGQGGIWKRGCVRLRRSLDAGVTWADAGKVFDNSLSIEEQRGILHLDDYCKDESGRDVGPPREHIDMSSPDAILIGGRAFCGPESTNTEGARAEHDPVGFCFRSPDRGRSWEEVPSIVWPHNTRVLFEPDNHIQLGDGKLLCWMVGYGDIMSLSTGKGTIYSPQLHASEDQGQTWHFYREIYCDLHCWIAASYPTVVVLPSGRWLCFLGCWHQAGGTRIRWTSLCASDDKGLNWSEPRLIHSWSISPFPLLLSDGRLVVIFMRRNPDPTGLYAIVSEDEGQHWSEPLCLRDDTAAAGPRGRVDGGYPVAVQLDDGRIFTAYYWQHEDADVPWHGGRKFIAGSFFKLD